MFRKAVTGVMVVPRQTLFSITPPALPSTGPVICTFAIGMHGFVRLISEQAWSQPLPALGFGDSPGMVGPRPALGWAVRETSQGITPETSTLPTRTIPAFVEFPPPPESSQQSPAT